MENVRCNGEKIMFFFFKQKTAYEIVDCDWSSDVCSSDPIISALFPSRVLLPHPFTTTPAGSMAVPSTPLLVDRKSVV